MSNIRYVKCVKLEGWNSLTIGKVYEVLDDFVEGYPNDIKIKCDDDGDIWVYQQSCFEDVAEVLPEQHKHYDFIVEWAKNPKRVVEYNVGDGRWIACISTPQWSEYNQYRFADTVESAREFPKTSLSYEHINALYNNSPTLVDLANSIIKQHILDTEKSNEND